MKKQNITLLLMLLAGIALAQTPAEFNALSEKVASNEATLQWLKNWGMPLGGLSVLAVAGMLFAQFKGLKSKAEAEVKKALQNELPAAVQKGIGEHPIGSLFAQELEARARPIVIVSKNGKDQKLVGFLNKNGFLNVNSYVVDKLEKVDSNKFDLLLFDNRQDQLMQQQTMDSVIEKFNTSCKYFYFTDGNLRFAPVSEIAKNTRMAGHANSEATLPKNLATALI